MSKYEMDKVIWLLSSNEDPEPFERYLADPDSILEGRDLTEEERKALRDCDVGELYRMGAQPFILMRWARLVGKVQGEKPDAFTARYIAAVTPHGHPDFST
jgi:hypothetical protein